jgi:Zn ribbon nucleic-acid-binding protein
MLANLKCPACFRAKIDFCEEETDNIAECQSCGCKFDLGPGFPEYGME